MDDVNPITQAEKTETVYTHGGAESKYILIQLEGTDKPDTMDVKINVEGLNRDQVLLLLKEVTATLEAEMPVTVA